MNEDRRKGGLGFKEGTIFCQERDCPSQEWEEEIKCPTLGSFICLPEKWKKKADNNGQPLEEERKQATMTHGNYLMTDGERRMTKKEDARWWSISVDIHLFAELQGTKWLEGFVFPQFF